MQQETEINKGMPVKEGETEGAAEATEEKPSIFELADRVEKGFKALFETLGRIFLTLLGMAFGPARAARRCIESERISPGPYTFLALSAFFFTKALRLVLFFIGVFSLVIARSCDGAPEVYSNPSPQDFLSEFLKAQLTWPTADAVLFKTIPIVLGVLVLAWVFGGRRMLGARNQRDRDYLTIAICYVVGTQFVVMVPVAALAFVILLYANEGELSWTLAVPCILGTVGWAGFACFRFSRVIFAERHTHGKDRRNLGTPLLIVAFIVSTLPLALASALTYPYARVDRNVLDEPTFKAAVIRVKVNPDRGQVEMDAALVNNTDKALFLTGDHIQLVTHKQAYYCGPLLEEGRERVGVTIKSHETYVLRVVLNGFSTKMTPNRTGAGAGVGAEDEQARRLVQCPRLKMPPQEKDRLVLDYYTASLEKEVAYADFEEEVVSGEGIDRGTVK